MASSKRSPNYARRFLLLAVLIVLVIAAYSAGWFYLARQIDARAATILAALNRDGVEAACTSRSVRGYPFRIGLYCDAVSFANTAEGVAFSAGEFRSAGQIYDPRFLIGELDSPAQLLPGAGLPPLEVDWEILRASVRLASPLPERVSAESRDLTITTQAGGGEAPAARLEHIEAHMRPNGSDLDLALRFNGLSVDPALVQGRAVPALSGEADIAVTDGVAVAAAGEVSLRGSSGTIRSARIAAGNASLSLSGPFTVNADGLVDADLQLSIENPEELSALVSQALPELADQVETLFSGLAAMGETPSLPLTISQGRVSIAFLDLGEIPPL